MPNWKKLITSGSSGSLANLAVDNAITASTLNVTSTGSFDRVEANTIDLDRLSLTSTQTTVPPLQLTANSLNDNVGSLRIDGSQPDVYLHQTGVSFTTVTFARTVSSNAQPMVGFGKNSDDNLYFFRETAQDVENTTTYDNTSFVMDRATGDITLGHNLSVEGTTSGSFTGSLLSTNGVLSSSAQIATDISGSFDVTTIRTYTGSFNGDGSGLTNISSDVTEQATVVDSFTSQTSVVTLHNFGTKNVIVNVFDSNDAMVIPDSIVTTDTNNVTTTFDTATSGRVVVAKGGHLVSGSAELFTYRETITGASSYAVTHSLSEDYPIVQVYSSSRAQVIPSEITTTSANALDITFSSTFNGTVVVKK